MCAASAHIGGVRSPRQNTEGMSTLSSGYINWHRLEARLGWGRHRQGGKTYIAAFWTVDYGRNKRDTGVGLLKNGDHPDWFLHADAADTLVAAYLPDKAAASPNYAEVFDSDWVARPLLGSVLLGSTDAVFRSRTQWWWASSDDLTRHGQSLIKKLDRLYEREAHIITFIERPTDEASGPRDLG